MPEELQMLTPVEESCIARLRSRVNIFTIRTSTNGGVVRMRGNVVAFPQNPDQLSELLPIIPDSIHIQVILIGPRKPSNADLKKILIVRRAVVLNALKWLKENNVFYQNVTICDNLVNNFLLYYNKIR